MITPNPLSQSITPPEVGGELVERVVEAMMETGIVIGASSWPDETKAVAEHLARAAIAAHFRDALGGEFVELVERARLNVPEHYVNWHHDASAALAATPEASKFAWAEKVEADIARLIDKSFTNGRIAGLEEARIATLSTPEASEGQS